MNIFETVGLAWVIFTSSIASIAILYLSYMGLRALLSQAAKDGVVHLPVHVKQLFKIVR